MTADPQPPARGIWPKAAPLLVLAGLLAYCNSFTKAFVFDDIPWIPNNPDIGSFSRYMNWGRPVVRLSVQLNYQLGGLNPAGYHALNLAVHVLAGLTLYGLVRRVLLLPRFAGRYDDAAPHLAFAVALLWLVHPLQTQSVTYIIQRCESMMGLFYLFALYAWLRGATGGGRWWYAAAVGGFALSCGCKEVSATLPPVLVAFDRVFLAPSWRALVRARWAAYLGVLAVWAATFAPLFHVAAGGGGTAGGIGFGLTTATPWTYLLTQSEVILYYLRLSVWPTGQALDYLDWPIARSLRDVWPAFAAVSAAAAASVALLYYRPAAGFVAFWFFALLAPTSSVMPIIDPVYEHRMYLSLAAVVIGLVFAGHALLAATRLSAPRRAAVGLTAVGAAACVLTALTFARNEDYRTQLRLTRENVAVRPNNARLWNTLVAMYLNAGAVDDADGALRRAEELPNTTGDTTRQRAPLFAMKGQLEESEVAYRAALNTMPFHSHGSAIMYRGLAWVQLARGEAGGGRRDDAGVGRTTTAGGGQPADARGGGVGGRSRSGRPCGSGRGRPARPGGGAGRVGRGAGVRVRGEVAVHAVLQGAGDVAGGGGVSGGRRPRSDDARHVGNGLRLERAVRGRRGRRPPRHRRRRSGRRRGLGRGPTRAPQGVRSREAVQERVNQPHQRNGLGRSPRPLRWWGDSTACRSAAGVR